MSGTKYPMTQRHIPEERVSHHYNHENLKVVIDWIYADGNQLYNFVICGKMAD
jgi:hypothetical protein